MSSASISRSNENNPSGQPNDSLSVIDNRNHILKDDLQEIIRPQDSLFAAAPDFSLYGIKEIFSSLQNVSHFHFLFTKPTLLSDNESEGSSQSPLRKEFYLTSNAISTDEPDSLFKSNPQIQLRDQLQQKSIGRRFVWWATHHDVRFRSVVPNSGSNVDRTLIVQGDDGRSFVYTPFPGFTLSGLGIPDKNSFITPLQRTGGSLTQSFLSAFNSMWNEDHYTQDITEQVLKKACITYQENPPELIYSLALYSLLGNSLSASDEDTMPNRDTGYAESEIWKHLYDFQREAAIAIINKLETYNGCVLADSVGLGKTFTALAVIKYYESRNQRVLVLCPKKLGQNWLIYRGNVRNNPFVDDRLRYDVLYHTDLLREKGKSPTGDPLDQINLGNYDLVVIDESHNFRNGDQNSIKTKQHENRYQRLLNRVIRDGVRTRVLMLTATPINNRFSDLQNQLALAYDGYEKDWEKKMRLSSSINDIFKNAQRAYTKWEKDSTIDQSSRALTSHLPYDFYTILDQVTVARSRKHIEEHYDMSKLGTFPHRNKPISRSTAISKISGIPAYSEICSELNKLTMAAYMPSKRLLASKRWKYEDSEHKGLSVEGQELGIARLMRVNLLKRLESSVSSFTQTLGRLCKLVNDDIQLVDKYISQVQTSASHSHHAQHTDQTSSTVGISTAPSPDDLDDDDQEESQNFIVGKSVRIQLSDIDYLTWRRDLSHDLEILKKLYDQIKQVHSNDDLKLADLKQLIRHKIGHPLNPGNKKIIVFTAFADTAEYLYENLAPLAKSLGLEAAIVTGGQLPRCTLDPHIRDMNQILTLFAPKAKERDNVYPDDHRNIDLLIATDCISEGQNLQDCDFLVNYDIHWNPVRIIQRFGRIDRIGSPNKVIQLVNYWPDVKLDEYLRLRERVEKRMKATIVTSTATSSDDPINDDPTEDLPYREKQLRRMHDEVLDPEEVQGGISITDLGLTSFRMDLFEYLRNKPSIAKLPHGLEAVASGESHNATPGIIFLLRQTTPLHNDRARIQALQENPLYPDYLVYVSDDGQISANPSEPRKILEMMRDLCRGKKKPEMEVARSFNQLTKNGNDMRVLSRLLDDALDSICKVKASSDINSFFSNSATTEFAEDPISRSGFELICFLVVR